LLPHAPLVKRNHCYENKTTKSISTDVLHRKLALLSSFPQVTVFSLHSTLVSWQRCFMFFLIASTQIRTFPQRRLHTALYLPLNYVTIVNPPTDFYNLRSQVRYLLHELIDVNFGMTMLNFQLLFPLFSIILPILVFLVR
jgi:hypothetical protein